MHILQVRARGTPPPPPPPPPSVGRSPRSPMKRAVGDVAFVPPQTEAFHPRAPTALTENPRLNCDTHTRNHAYVAAACYLFFLLLSWWLQTPPGDPDGAHNSYIYGARSWLDAELVPVFREHEALGRVVDVPVIARNLEPVLVLAHLGEELVCNERVRSRVQ